jgi:hypothetical protein
LADAPIVAVVRRVEQLLGAAVLSVIDATGHDPSDRFRSLYLTPADAIAAVSPAADVHDPAAVAELAEEDALGLVRRFRLEPLDHALVVLALIPDIEPRLGRAFAYLNDDIAMERPTIDLALRLLVGELDARLAAASRLAARAPLVHLGLVDRPRLSPTPALGEPLIATPGLVAWVLGDDVLAERLPGARFVPLQPSGLEARQITPLQMAWDRLGRGSWPPQLSLAGGDADVRRRVAANLAARLSLPLLAVELDPAAPDAALHRADARREALLRDAVLLVEGDPRGLEDYPGPAIGDEEAGDLPVLAVPPVTSTGRRMLWESALGPGDVAEMASTRLLLDAAGIQRTCDLAMNAAAGEGREVTMADVATAARHDARHRLAHLATAVEPRASFADLVIPDSVIQQLQTLVDRVAHRSRVRDEWGFAGRRGALGVSALFAGPSGTGKSMAAEVIAAELDLPLWRIDLARVVSKYIGETEKNLDAVFEAAEASAAAVLFDEADALFGKRSEVQDAHDRYANLEIAYLLQRMETYSGVAILSTNLLHHLDDAFARRLTFTIHFPFPDSELRRRLWRRAWPAAAPLGDLDPVALADEHLLSGANIANAALHAAHLAAADGGVIDDGHVRAAIGLERTKLGWIEPVEVSP